MMRLEVTIEGITSVSYVKKRDEMRYARHCWRLCETGHLKPDTLITVKEKDGTVLEILRLDELFTNPFIK
jgi:predicted signal transduction protein with EAL and GGDEF domain